MALNKVFIPVIADIIEMYYHPLHDVQRKHMDSMRYEIVHHNCTCDFCTTPCWWGNECSFDCEECEGNDGYNCICKPNQSVQNSECRCCLNEEEFEMEYGSENEANTQPNRPNQYSDYEDDDSESD